MIVKEEGDQFPSPFDDRFWWLHFYRKGGSVFRDGTFIILYKVLDIEIQTIYYLQIVYSLQAFDH